MVHGLGPWTGSMGWSMDQVHMVVHGPRSMFCIRPAQRAYNFDTSAVRNVCNSRLCDRLRSSVIIWKQLSLRSSAIRDRLRSYGKQPLTALNTSSWKEFWSNSRTSIFFATDVCEIYLLIWHNKLIYGSVFCCCCLYGRHRKLLILRDIGLKDYFSGSFKNIRRSCAWSL